MSEDVRYKGKVSLVEGKEFVDFLKEHYVGAHIGEEQLLFSVLFAGLAIISALMFLLWVEASVQVDDLYWEVNKQNN